MTPMLATLPLPDLLDAFSSSAPTPGGGSAAAVSGALGASLLAMVAGLPKTRSNTPEERAALDEARATLLTLRATLLDLIDRDAAAYDLVVAAFKQPKSTDEEKAARTAAIQDAMRVAAEVPLETMRACREVLAAGCAVAEHGSLSAASDVAVATFTLTSAMQGAMFNVTTNLDSIKDPAVSDRIAAAAKEIVEAPRRAILMAPMVRDLLEKSARRLGFGTHGHSPDSRAVPAETFAVPATELLRRMGTPEARAAIESLALSRHEVIAGAAKMALEKFEARE
jgi:methenyltetrahydrofolate cyclohydrolase